MKRYPKPNRIPFLNAGMLPRKLTLLLALSVWMFSSTDLIAQPSLTKNSASEPVVETLTEVSNKTEANKSGENPAAAPDPYKELEALAAPYTRFNKIVKAVIKVCRPTVVHNRGQKIDQEKQWCTGAD